MQALLIVRRQFDLDLLCHGPSHLGLHPEHIMEASLVTLSPQVRFIADPDQLCRDAHPLPRPAYGTFQHVRHAELTTDLPDALRSRLELHRRGSGDYPEVLRAQPGELGNHLLGQSVAEIVVSVPTREVLERQ